MPRYQDIARQLKTAIEQGELKPGARLPSSRTWSQELGVSRSTVENACAELVAQGWLIRRGQAGTFVSERIYPQQSTVQVVAFAGESQQPLPFQMGLPALDLFPRELWARVMGLYHSRLCGLNSFNSARAGETGKRDVDRRSRLSTDSPDCHSP